MYWHNNVTERKRAEQALRSSEERFSKIFRSSPVAMSLRRVSDWGFVDVNESFERITGYSRQELLGHTSMEMNLWIEPDGETVFEAIKEKGSIYNLEIKFRKKSGDTAILLFSAEIIKIGGQRLALTVASDITEKKKLEQEIVRLDRLNLVGQMAAGIGHEIRNPMTTVRGFLQLLGSKKEYHSDKKYYDLMIEELDRANSIITEFLSVARIRPENLESVNLNSIIEALSPLIMADAMNSGKDFVTELNDIPDLPLNQKEIRQLILNLARNGFEAMVQGKTLAIRTYAEENDVVLSVRDQGGGMAGEVRENLGTPFLTTKENGTGLGLATCFSIAARHNAVIDVETGPEGTTFYIRFRVL